MQTYFSRLFCFALTIVCWPSFSYASHHASNFANPNDLMPEIGSVARFSDSSLNQMMPHIVLVQQSNPFGEDPFGEPTPSAAPATPEPTEDPFGAPATPATPSADPFGEAEAPAAAAPSVVPPTTVIPEINSIPSAPTAGTMPDAGLLDESSAGELLAREVELRQAAAQALEQDIRNQLNEAQGMMAKNPSAVKNALKARLEELEVAVDLDPTVRAQLRDRLLSAVQAAAEAEGRYLDKLQRAETVRAQADASQRLIAEINRQDEAIKQLVEQFNFLLSEGNYLEASKDISPEVERLTDGTPLASTIRETSSLRANYSIVREAFEAREQGFVDAMRGVEVAAIPIDEPSVLYPPAEVWQALSARRKERYGAVNLAGGSKAEQKITAALKQTANDIDFQGEPLNQIMETLQDTYNIPIRLNTVELGVAGVNPDEPVNIKLPPVSLRSALRQILAEIDIAELTYTIRDEVLLITTQEDADEVPQVKVYPVGDLVVTPMMLQMSGGGMMGGMGGGMGGMGGGMGGMGGMGGGMGGMGGMGGGMGGMGGMGMGGMGGGGMFDIPDNAAKR